MSNAIDNIQIQKISCNNVTKTSTPQTQSQVEEENSNKNSKLLLALTGLAVVGLSIAAIKYHKKPVVQENVISKQKNINNELISKYGLDKEFYETRPMTMYRDIVMDVFYPQIRKTKTPYSTRSACYSEIAKITSAKTAQVNTLIQNGWHYRIPKTQDKAPIVDRISLNAYPEKDLIKKLDDLVAKSNGKIEYKTPNDLNGWNDRHDPITIYFRRPVNKSDESAVMQLAQPHIRTTSKEVLIGRKISNGIYEVPEPTEKDVQALIERAKKLGNNDLVKVIEDPSGFGLGLYKISVSTGEKKVHSSPGILESVKRLLDDLEK